SDCSPINKETFQACLELPRSFKPSQKLLLCLGSVEFLSCGIHKRKASIEATDQMPSDQCQPKLKLNARGTLIPAETIAPKAKVPEYRLVIISALFGKSRFTKLGINTLAKAIPIPNANVPPKSAVFEGITRINSPAVSSNKAAAMVVSMLIRRVTSGVKAETTPKARSGRVVNKPSRLFESPVVSRIASIRGPTLAKAGRRLKETRSIPPMSSTFRRDEFCSKREVTDINNLVDTLAMIRLKKYKKDRSFPDRLQVID